VKIEKKREREEIERKKIERELREREEREREGRKRMKDSTMSPMPLVRDASPRISQSAVLVPYML
jgi:hypothetical protein